jgi:hypothetical protein
MPVRLARFRLDELGGYRATTLGFDQLIPGYRSIEPDQARFVSGRGDGFIGVWDRERPEEPIERFGEDDYQWQLADQLRDDLLLRWLGENMLLAGLRRFAVVPAFFTYFDHPFDFDPKGPIDRNALKKIKRRQVLDPSRPPTRWLIAEEEPNTLWEPIFPGSAGTYHTYLIHEEAESLAIHHRGAAPSLDRAGAKVSSADGETPVWLDVPETVPRNLYETTAWVGTQILSATA